MAKQRVPGSMNDGAAYPFDTTIGTEQKGPTMAAAMSPPMPEPPIPRMTTFSTASWLGRPSRPSARRAAAATWSGRAAARSNMPIESRMSLTSGLEGGSDPVGLGLGDEPLVLLVGDGLGLVDEHDRDVVGDGVPALQPGVVEALLVLEVEERTLVLGAGEDLEQLGVEGHGMRVSLGSLRRRPCGPAPRPRGPRRRRDRRPRG